MEKVNINGDTYVQTDSGLVIPIERYFGDLLVGKDTTSYDVVSRPKHYNRAGGMESIDEMVLVFGPEAVKNFCLCNVWKYRYRAADKNGEEDLRKSDWYMNKYKELCEDYGPNY